MNIEDEGVQITKTCSACPEQYEGTVDGNPIYFRLRHGYWTFCISKPGADPILPYKEDILYFKDGPSPDGGDGCTEDAPGLIMSMVREFRESKE